MELSSLQGTSLYIPIGLQAASAVWGYIPRIDPGTPTVDLASTWNLGSGYYVFFPAADRGAGWKAFADGLKAQMRDGTNRRFGFFDVKGAGIGFLSVSGTGDEQALTVGDTFRLRNIALVVSPIENLVSASLSGNTFLIQNLSVSGQQSVVLDAAPGGSGPARRMKPVGSLRIPGDGDTPGTLSFDLTMDPADQAALETGPMYFSAAGSGPLTALRYPTFVNAQSAAASIAVTGHIDPALPADATRTYFRLTDRLLGSTFSTTDGRQITLAPRDGAQDPSGLSARFLLADRPVQRAGDGAAYYLTPAGSFTVGATGGDAPGQLICAYSATEVLSFTPGDVLRFVPGNAAYHDAGAARQVSGAPVYLTPAATTSWIGLTSTAAQNTYFSQPQDSPIYQSNGVTGGGPYLANQLSFRSIPAWPPPGGAAAGASPQPTALIPMVPYGGVAASGADLAERYEAMETMAINPERRRTLVPPGARPAAPKSAAATGEVVDTMTPLGLVAGFDQDEIWTTTKLAVSGPSNERLLQIRDMQDAIRDALQQNQIFLVIDQRTSGGQPLFTFGPDDATVELSGWFFDLQLQGQSPDGVPPILLLKLFRDRSLKELVDDRALWADESTFSSDPALRQEQIQRIFSEAEEAVKADPTSPYAGFVRAIQDPSFTGLLALNSALRLEHLPAPIKALLGGMTKADGTSNIAAFRAHHVGVQINDTSDGAGVAINASSLFALVDYEDSSAAPEPRERRAAPLAPAAAASIFPCGPDGRDCYDFKVITLQALFENNALTHFSAEIDLTVKSLFAVAVKLAGGNAGDVIRITGSYSEHGGAQTYSFVAVTPYHFTFAENPYLKKITFDKVQFSSTETQPNAGASAAALATTTKISSRFAIWGSMEFNKLEFLDMFAFEKLSFADLGIEMSYLLTVQDGGQDPVTSDLSLWFAPGDLRFDFSDTKQRDGDDSMLALLPFKLQSFLYSEKGKHISELSYFGISLGSFGVETSPTFNFALLFELDLGSLGFLVSSQSAFKLNVLLGWQPPTGSTPNALVFGVQMPEADGKLQIDIQGVLKIIVEQFVLEFSGEGDDELLALVMHDSYMEVLGVRMPPGKIAFDFALFAPTKGEDKIGWIAAFNNGAEGGSAARGAPADGPLGAVANLRRAKALAPAAQEDEDGGLFKLDFIGAGQRVGPATPPTDFAGFLEYMKTTFWQAVTSGDYASVYQPDGGWIVVASFELLAAIGVGFVFYDTSAFYSLTIGITKAPLQGVSFQITYTKISDDVGLFFIDLTLPDALRTFQAGAASITLPALALSVYTNGDFKIDLGFPANNDWTRSFRVEAFAGPVPVTGSGGFYIAKLSSATDNTFKNTDYSTILAGGFGARLGVGKNFTAGPLKAGVSLTFFGIIEGAMGYHAYDAAKDGNVVRWLTTPKALALKGQFGVIGELYGTLDFAIVKASVNVKIQATIGVQLLLEDGRGGDILLWVDARVEVSVKVKINLGFFSIKIGFSFKMGFRFEWRLLDSGQTAERARLAAVSAPVAYDPSFPLQAGLSPNLSSWMTPELTSVWTDPTLAGTPWFVVSLSMEYVDDFAKVTSTADFKSFETLAAQMVAWALNATLGLPSWDAKVSQILLDTLNQYPNVLVGKLTYDILLDGLSKMFVLAVESVPPADGKTADADKETKFATILPMLPFLGLKTTGRGADLDYVFQAKSRVSEEWIRTELQAYFEQLYTNITSGNDRAAAARAAAAGVPLVQAFFLDWFHAVIRSTVNALLTQMQNDDLLEARVDELYLAAVKSGQIRNVAGQMAQFFRSGLRLPQTAGMELPDNLPLGPTNALYGLMWQEFPVGGFTGPGYRIDLVPDPTQSWVRVNATWELLETAVAPYRIPGTSISVPGSPAALPALQRGPQAFALANPVDWTPAGGATTTVRPVSDAMRAALKARAPLSVRLLSRTTGEAYDAETAAVPASAVRWALAVEMVIRKVPVATGVYLRDTYALGAADVAVQNQMRALLAALGASGGLVKSIELLYQPSRDEPGVVSSPDPERLFVLRTNTTTESVPPPTALALAVEPGRPAVGADTSDPFGFLQILEQASVTNQTGYYLTFRDHAGSSLPAGLFGDQSFAPVTFLFELDIPAASGVYAVERYVNAAVIDGTTGDRLYYAETTDAAEETSYVGIASGAAGVEMKRTEPGETTVADQLSQLYSLVAFQVPASTGFIESNLSVPSGPQKEDEASPEQRYRLFVPLYKLATDNQGKAEPNRYASIGATYSVNTLVVDAFGNAFGQPRTAIANRQNLYSDDIVALGAWTGVRSTFDFNAQSTPSDDAACAARSGAQRAAAGTPEKGKLTVYLCPSAEALPEPFSESAAATLELYTTILDQLTGPAVTLFVSTNLDPAGSDIALSAAQTTAVLEMVRSIRRYLQGEAVTLRGVALTVAVPGSSDDLSLVFQIQVSFGIKRTDFLAPEVASYEDASRVTTSVAAAGAANDLTRFAADFSVAFPAFSLAVGPADASDVSVGAPERAAAAAEATPAQPKGLWAVSRKVTDLSISTEVRRYLAPKPLATRLRSGTVPMPRDLPALRSLPATRTFSDADLDNLAQEAFGAIDSALEAENASNVFQSSPSVYASIAYAREDIADRYADNEVAWLLDDPRFVGSASDLCQGRDQMAQQMRAALSSAYAVDTIVQTTVTFHRPLPSTMGNRLQLFGQMQRVGGEISPLDSGGFGLGTARADVPAGSGGQSVTTTFLYGLTKEKLEQARYRNMPLEWAVTHLQVFLQDREIDYCKRDEVAPPSIWLQLVNAFAEPPKMGETIIPLPFREYPTPPAAIAQTATRDMESPAASLADQTRWIYTTTYQARLLAADEITLDLAYNSGAPESPTRAKAAATEQKYTLFEALARFQAGYAILQPQMTPVTPSTPPDVLSAFATLVTQLADNSDWTGSGALAASKTEGPVLVVERDVVTDRLDEGTEGRRLITLRPDPLAKLPNPWVGDKCITALDPSTMKPYPGEVQSCSGGDDHVVTHAYTPVPPLSANFVTHQIRVKGLTTLLYENGNSGVGLRRNASLYPDGAVVSKPEFVYKTPIVALTNPVTPFVDNPTPIQIYPVVVPEKSLDLGDYVRRTLGALMGLDESGGALKAAEGVTRAQLAQQRRLKIDARFGFPIGAPAGVSAAADRFVPLAPAVLVRSFDLPVEGLSEALNDWVGMSGDTGTTPEPYAAVLAKWLEDAGIGFGEAASPQGAMLVLDVTLYSRLTLDGHQVPLLRLSQLRLQLSAVAPPPQQGTRKAV